MKLLMIVLDKSNEVRLGKALLLKSERRELLLRLSLYSAASELPLKFC